MAQTGYTPISLYYSTTAAQAPSAGNLVNGELAINITDGKLYYKDNVGAVKVLAGSGGTGIVAGSNTQIQFNNSGVFGASSSLTWDGTYLTAGSIKNSALTSGRITFAGASGLLSDSASLLWDGSFLTAASIKDSALTSGRVTYAGASGLLQDSVNLTFNGTTLTANTLNLTNALTTTYGGTGLTSFTAGDLPYYATGTALSKLAIGTNGQILTSSGTAPQWTTLSGVAVTTFSAGTTGFTPNSATSGAVTLAGTLATTNGGTGLTSFTANGVVYASSSSALTTGSALTFDGSTLKAAVSGNSAVTANNVTSELSIQSVGNDGYINMTGTGGTVFRLGSGYTEQMRLTSTGLGIGTSSPGGKLEVYSGASGATAFSNGTNLIIQNNAAVGMSLLSPDANAARIYFGTASNNRNAFIYSDYNSGAQTLIFGVGTSTTAATEKMRLDSSGNLGIGTSSPGAKLDVSGTARANTLFFNYNTGFYANDGYISNYSAANYLYVNGNTAGGLALRSEGGGNTALWLDGSTNANGSIMRFNTAGAERMRLDSSGNLGLGVTPSAWGTSEFKAVQVGNGASFYGRVASGDQDKAGMSSNAYNNGSGWFYIATDSSAKYDQIGGGHYWYTAPSGTAGNAITFTQAMTLDASGNLGIGVTPSAYSGLSAGRLEVGAVGNSLFSNGSTNFWLTTNTNYETGTGYKYATTGVATMYLQTAGQHQWHRAGSGTAGNAITFTQAMTLDASGNLALGRTSVSTIGTDYRTVDLDGLNGSGFRFRSNGTTIGLLYSAGTSFLDFGTTGAYPLTFTTNGSERARITSGGDFWVGTTTAISPGGLTANNVLSAGTSSQWAAAVRNSTATTPWGLAIQYSGASPNGTSSTFLFCEDSTATRATIRSNGGIANYQANDVNLSDRREKTNFAPAKSYLDTICAIPVQTFNYIDQSEDDPGLTLGVVAQDVQAVAPELVMESNWGTEDNPKMRLSIYQTDLQYALMKCIQELKAEVDSLKAQLKGA